MTSLADMTPFPPPVHPYLPWVIAHIAAGCLAILAGYTAVLAAKGGTLHRRVGTVFVASMLIGTSVAVYLAVSLLGELPMQIPNIAAGTLAFYLTLSAYMTVKRKEGTIGLFERVSFLIPLGLSGLFFFWGLRPSTARPMPSTDTGRRCFSSSGRSRCCWPGSI